MAYQDDWRHRDPDWPRHGHRPYQDEYEGREYRRPSTGALVPGNAGSGPFGGYGPAGYAPSSHTEFHGGEYLTGGMPGQFAGTFPAGGDFIGAGGMVISGLDSGGTLPTAGQGGVRRPDWRPQGRFAGRGPRGYRRSDERIAEDVNERLTWHSQLDAGDVEVSVENCEVTLTGTVDSRFAKRLAEDIAESCPGVIDVHNKLKVERSGSHPRSSDREVSRDVARDHDAAANREEQVKRAVDIDKSPGQRHAGGRSRRR